MQTPGSCLPAGVLFSVCLPVLTVGTSDLLGALSSRLGGRLEALGALLRLMALGLSCSPAFPPEWTSRSFFSSISCRSLTVWWWAEIFWVNFTVSHFLLFSSYYWISASTSEDHLNEPYSSQRNLVVCVCFVITVRIVLYVILQNFHSHQLVNSHRTYYFSLVPLLFLLHKTFLVIFFIVTLGVIVNLKQSGWN